MVAAASDQACPDPSAHAHTLAGSPKLQDQASKAALYVTQPHSSNGSAQPRQISALGPDGKLSSAGAAASLKYAKAQDLPSFPTVGIDTASSGKGAAALAAANQKSFEYWKPELSASASAAALIAHKDGGKVNLWQPTPSEAGFGAAGAAMSKQHTLSPQLDYGYTEIGRNNSRKAATLSHRSSTRVRSDSAPAPPANLYPDQQNAVFNALNAATVANNRTVSHFPTDAANEASRIKNIRDNLPREMWTEHPPVAIEVEEKRHQDALRASSVVFAKQMMDYANRSSVDFTRTDNSADITSAAVYAHANQPAPIREQDFRAQAEAYVGLQEQAQKLAAERLAKLDPDGVHAYREKWGYPVSNQKTKFFTRTGRERRASTGREDVDQANRINHQMSKLNAQVASVDAKKHQVDLLAAAQAKVKANMNALDSRIFEEKGIVSPDLMKKWEAEAQAKAAADSELRMVNHGKIHIGGGKFMDQSEIDAIAQGRMQPTFDEIDDSAEKRRASDIRKELDLEEAKRQAVLQRQRDNDTQAELKRVNNEAKAKLRAEKDAEKAKKAAEKDAAKAHARAEKEEKKHKKSGSGGGGAVFAVPAAAVAGTVAAGAAITAGTSATGGLLSSGHHDEHIDPLETTPAVEDVPADTTATEPVLAHDPVTDPVVATDANAPIETELEAEIAPVEKIGETIKADQPTLLNYKDTTASEPVESVTDATVVPAVAAVDTAETSAPVETTTSAAPIPVTPTKSRRDSKIKGIFGKFKRSKGSEKTASSSSTPVATPVATPIKAGEASVATPTLPEPVTVTSNANDEDLYAEASREAANVDVDDTPKALKKSRSPSLGSIESAANTVTRGRNNHEELADETDVTDTADEYEEARDQFEDDLTPPPKTLVKSDSIEGSPARKDSKFQEEL